MEISPLLFDVSCFYFQEDIHLFHQLHSLLITSVSLIMLLFQLYSHGYFLQVTRGKGEGDKREWDTFKYMFMIWIWLLFNKKTVRCRIFYFKNKNEYIMKLFALFWPTPIWEHIILLENNLWNVIKYIDFIWYLKKPVCSDICMK